MNLARPILPSVDERIKCDILRLAKQPVSAIYFLSDGEYVIYVGQSRDVGRRIKEHSDKNEFVYAWFERCEPRDLNRLEAAAMQKYAGPHLLNEQANARA